MNAHTEGQPSPAGGAGWPRILAALACAVALAVVLSGFGVRLGIWDYRMGFQILRVAPYVALAICAVALVALVGSRWGAQRVRSLAVAFVVSAVASVAPLAWSRIAREGPPINDITTDTANPPEFVAVIPLRAQSPVESAYPGEATAALQRSG